MILGHLHAMAMVIKLMGISHDGKMMGISMEYLWKSMEYLWEINNFMGISMEYGNDIMVYIIHSMVYVVWKIYGKYGYDIPILDTSIWGFP